MTRTREENARDLMQEPDPNALLDEVNALIEVRCSFLISCGVYSGQVTRRNLAELLRDWLGNADEDDLAESIDGHSLLELSLDDGAVLYRSEGG